MVFLSCRKHPLDAATPRETVPALLSRTDSEFALRNCDHLRRPRCALGRSAPVLPGGKPAAPLRVRRSSRRGDRLCRGLSQRKSAGRSAVTLLHVL
jgi:hypothetical protein